MRIESGNVTGPRAGRLEEAAAPAHRAGTGRAPGEGEDRLELSGLAARIRAGLDALAVGQRSRVEELAKQYGAGQYRVDESRLARALLEQREV
ncbi:MAG: flagellar biosynthesis anti-sigma factor FlgM [Bryobacteraceae bacterium]